MIIPTRNRSQLLRRTLEALERQSLPRSSFEVICVDDGSAPEHRRALQDLHPRLAFQLARRPHGGLAAARNTGARRASGEILLFLDDDVAPVPGSLRAHLEGHAGGALRVVIGAVVFSPRLRRTAFQAYLERSGYYDLYADPNKYPQGRPPLPPMQGNASVPRALFERAGGYDESFCTYGGEDLELGHRLAKLGAEFFYEPRARGLHLHAKDFARFCDDMEQLGAAIVRIWRKHPEIRAAKKIDVLQDPIWRLPPGRWHLKLVLSITEACPWLLAGPRAILAAGDSHHVFRGLLFPLFRWVAYYHYAQGMRRGLEAIP